MSIDPGTELPTKDTHAPANRAARIAIAIGCVAIAAVLWAVVRANGILPVLLWTDALVFLLLTVLGGYFAYVRRHGHLRAPWQRVTSSGAGLGSLTVLAAFLLIGVADCVHYRVMLPQKSGEAPAYSPEVLSVLDALTSRFRARSERTYSSPLAMRAYSRETVELPGGRQAREFPRLVFGGKHLKDDSEHSRDLTITAVRGLAMAFVLWWFVASLATLAIARSEGRRNAEMWGRIWSGDTRVPWVAVLGVLAVMFAIAGPVIALAGGYHVLGTDKVGQDVLYLSLKSIRTSLVIGTLTTLVLLPVAVSLGIAAGYLKGWVDDAIQYVYTTLNSIPSVLLIAASVLMVQGYIDAHPELFPTAAQRADLRLLFLCVILGLTSWTGLARLLRGEALKLRELEFVQAAQAFGVGRGRIISRHLLPNVMHIVLISLVMDFSGFVLAEAALSYVGVGVDPSMISFGTMINAARLEMAREPMVWWALAAAFAFMFVLVLAANLFADAVRDAFDPRVQIGRGSA